MAEIVVLHHTEGAGPSGFEEVLDARRTIAPWRLIRVPDGTPLPDELDPIAGIIVMGGPMSAVDPDAHGWMAGELELLRRAVADAVPVLGVCLGAQLLGAALGGKVVGRDVPEIGFVALHRTPAGRDDAVISGWPDGAAALFLHEDEVADLPADADPLLTGSDGVPAWRLASAWAVQFHPEVTADQLAEWVDSQLVADLFERAGVEGADLVDEARRRARVTVPLGRALVGRFLDGPVRLRTERER